ncbi:hypothetical protein [Amycolatopsis sp. H20-H5]|uniref:hypothetical protein n=1 Tax=Amycolatopsis sp. H20-H5 TaxID=3046309 RepID=UPI002DB5E39B|nr:hypothetical protein [Amycolatopsis sp. H20-H5]MEC3974441.1 hypothetical protein [Amycolatopsis sp. H20-H5]
MPRNRLLTMLDEHVVPIGMQCFTGNHTLIEVLGATGFDYVWLDTEHSALDPRALEDTMHTCEAAAADAGTAGYTRPPAPPSGFPSSC